MSSQGTTPQKTIVPSKQIGTLLPLAHRAACSIECVRILTSVTYNIPQVKIGQDSRRAAWAQLGVGLRVFAVVFVSNVKKGIGVMFFCGLKFKSFSI